MLETKKYWILSLLIIVLVAFLPKFSSTGRVGGAYVESDPSLPLAPDRMVLLPEKTGFGGDPDLGARAVLVKDINSGLLLLEKNKDTALPIASLTKLLTALLVYKSGGLAGTAVVEEADTKVVPPTAKLVPGEELAVADLARVMLVASANDSAMVLARTAGGSVENFVSEMNKLARTLGMLSSSFTNPVGFDNPGHYSTAGDLTLLIDAFLAVPELGEMVSKREAVLPEAVPGVERKFQSTNILFGEDRRIAGIKTGYTTDAGGSLAILVSDLEHPYYLIVIGSASREDDARKLIQWIEESYQWR